MTFRAYLLDIEGTTTPIDFVTRTLFPFARREIERAALSPLESQFEREDIEHLWKEYQADPLEVTWTSPNEVAGAVSYLLALMNLDQKSTALKSIQGKLWSKGYESGNIVGEIYSDVQPAIERWIENGAKVAIFSSGSVLAQKLLFSHLPSGDLTSLIEAYFDTTIGTKRDPDSYFRIASTLAVPASESLFLSDVIEEVEAARNAGFTAIRVVREGNLAENEIRDFTGL